ncbi:MAG TPA: DNA adenine methylase [Solirubrobacterales bacterium]|nr:DNA adenine methylase [Solirubrobacterales bacterium]
MGSKRVMLQNGFGSAICSAARESERIVDLFAGSGAVAWYAAEKLDQPVLAVDLQAYSAVLSGAVISRTRGLNLKRLEDDWLAPAGRGAHSSDQWLASEEFSEPFDRATVERARILCQEQSGGMIWHAYGGHYFSPRQALFLDCALDLLPPREPARSICRAALIAAAGYCAAAPGHTAQPFQPTDSAIPYIRDFWRRDPLGYARSWLTEIAPRHAKKKGQTEIADALDVVEELKPTDLVIVDPPYSDVQYSRFYHVLEAIARADGAGPGLDVSGVGRYPPFADRPRSDFSLKSRSQAAIEDLLDALADAGCRAIITFPTARCSNGLSGAQIARLAKRQFAVKTKTVKGKFSTLGGNGSTRAARAASAELIISLSPTE